VRRGSGIGIWCGGVGSGWSLQRKGFHRCSRGLFRVLRETGDWVLGTALRDGPEGSRLVVLTAVPRQRPRTPSFTLQTIS
jgi:hypothetical protein